MMLLDCLKWRNNIKFSVTSFNVINKGTTTNFKQFLHIPEENVKNIRKRLSYLFSQITN